MVGVVVGLVRVVGVVVGLVRVLTPVFGQMKTGVHSYLDQLGLSEEVEQVTYHGSTYRLSARQKPLRATQQQG